MSKYLNLYQFKEIFFKAPLPLILVNLKTYCIEEVNPALQAWLGYSTTDILENPCWCQRFLHLNSSKKQKNGGNRFWSAMNN